MQCSFQRLLEHAPRIRGTDRQMDRQGRGRNQPAAPPRWGDDTFPTEKRRTHVRVSVWDRRRRSHVVYHVWDRHTYVNEWPPTLGCTPGPRRQILGSRRVFAILVSLHSWSMHTASLSGGGRNHGEVCRQASATRRVCAYLTAESQIACHNPTLGTRAFAN